MFAQYQNMNRSLKLWKKWNATVYLSVDVLVDQMVMLGVTWVVCKCTIGRLVRRE